MLPWLTFLPALLTQVQDMGCLRQAIFTPTAPTRRCYLLQGVKLACELCDMLNVSVRLSFCTFAVGSFFQGVTSTGSHKEHAIRW